MSPTTCVVCALPGVQAAVQRLRLQAKDAGNLDSSDYMTVRVRAESAGPAWAVIALRPANPEGVSFVRRVELAEDRRGWTVNGRHEVRFDTPGRAHNFFGFNK